MKLLVTGGAGYVGSVCAAHLVDAGHEVTVLDDLSTGHRDAVPDGARFVEADLADAADDAARRRLRRRAALRGAARWSASRCSARSCTGRATWSPRCGCSRRSAATARRGWCSPRPRPPTASRSRSRSREDAPTRPTNPYGASKLAIDHAITSYAAAHGLAAVSLRYFNVAGAHGRFGERHAVETHLIPLVLQVAAGHRASRCRSSATTGRPRTAPACATTSTSTTSPTPTCWRCSTPGPGRHAIYNLGWAPASRCAR